MDTKNIDNSLTQEPNINDELDNILNDTESGKSIKNINIKSSDINQTTKIKNLNSDKTGY
ncbi:MAG: hypothetical protein U0354_09185 [Candidatus Sericytochromatia bacterium]